MTTVILFCYCSERTTEPVVNPSSKNPVIISFSEEREIEIKNKWNSFLNKYNCSSTVIITEFNNVTSYLHRFALSDNYPTLFSEPPVEIYQQEIIDSVLVFYSKWENLFGCKSVNLEFYEFSPIVNYTEMIIIFEQKKLNGISCDFARDYFLSFLISRNGDVIEIASNLLPDVDIKTPADFKSDVIKENIYGYKIYYYESGIRRVYTLSENDGYDFSDGYIIVTSYTEDELKIYAAKETEVTPENSDVKKHIFYCHPLTGEIILVKESSD